MWTFTVEGPEEGPRDPAELNLLHFLQLGGQPVTAGPQNEDFREGHLLGFRAKVIFKSGLARWGPSGLIRVFHLIS